MGQIMVHGCAARYFQIQEGDCGDYWGVAGGMEDVTAVKKSDSEYAYNPAGQL